LGLERLVRFETLPPLKDGIGSLGSPLHGGSECAMLSISNSGWLHVPYTSPRDRASVLEMRIVLAETRAEGTTDSACV
jgi:hypothetical protein